jgi:lysophospholipase L1-like esterase
MLIEPNSKLLMTGDSITDFGRAYPVGEADGLGNGYVSLVYAWLNITHPAHYIRVMNTGIGGNTVLDLEARWETDVLALQPDWLSVMIGINDVWRRFESPPLAERHVPLELFTATLEKLVTITRPLLKGLVLMSPYFIEPDRAEPMRAMMDEYGAAMRRVAKTHQAVFVDTQAAFDTLMRDIPPEKLAPDRVHPNLTGHMLLARAFLAAVERQPGSLKF